MVLMVFEGRYKYQKAMETTPRHQASWQKPTEMGVGHQETTKKCLVTQRKPILEFYFSILYQKINVE